MGEQCEGAMSSAIDMGSGGELREGRTVCAVDRGVEEEESLVDDATDRATGADEATHNAGGAARHEGHHSVGCSAAALCRAHLPPISILPVQVYSSLDRVRNCPLPTWGSRPNILHVPGDIQLNDCQ